MWANHFGLNSSWCSLQNSPISFHWINSGFLFHPAAARWAVILRLVGYYSVFFSSWFKENQNSWEWNHLEQPPSIMQEAHTIPHSQAVSSSHLTRTTADRRPWSFRAFKVLFDDFECIITMVLTVNVFFLVFSWRCAMQKWQNWWFYHRVNFGGFGKRRYYFHRAFIFSSSSGRSNASNSSRKEHIT